MTDNPLKKVLVDQQLSELPFDDPGPIEYFAKADAEREMRLAGFASFMAEPIMERIVTFQASLDSKEEIGACLAGFGGRLVVRVEDVVVRNPHLLVLVGRDDEERRVELVQHISQLNLLLVAVPTRNGEPGRRIGFAAKAQK